MLSSKDIFYIKGVHEIIIDYKEEMERLTRQRVANRQNESLTNHINRMRSIRNHRENLRNRELFIRNRLGINF